MALEVVIQGSVARILMKGRFDFHVHRDFKEAYMKLFEIVTVQQIEIDMSKLEYLDSSALGMLMLLNERAKSVNKTVTLLNPSGVVSQVLDVANFSRLFNITTTL